mgnify:CR=1 FL=1
MPFRKLFVANRGEIAVRVIRAARELGIATVQAHSAADRDGLAVRLADEAVEIGPAAASKSYLDVDRVVEAAKASGADAVHPGYGFLAENARFADAVTAAGMTFVGPSGDVIRTMGDKVAARVAADRAGVPTVPGSLGRVADLAEAEAVVADTGFPVMIKAAAGGGGRGIRIAHDLDEFRRLFPQASAEAKAAFGDGGLYLEKAITRARHVEVQVLGDGHRSVHCFERECSLQRRRQKVWEEGPAPAMAPHIREALCRSAADLAEAVGYRGAGTVEFLYDDVTHHFYFIEMNTRIQVEHPVTEMITGLDLIREMILVAAGEPLPFGQGDISASGHAIEVRINAEDPARDFMPSPGTVSSLRVPGGPGVRFDTLLYDGYTVPPFYDSLLGKLVVWAPDRPRAIARLKRALGELEVTGIATTKPLFLALADDPHVAAGRVHTRWLEEWLADHAAGLARP